MVSSQLRRPIVQCMTFAFQLVDLHTKSVHWGSHVTFDVSLVVDAWKEVNKAGKAISLFIPHLALAFSLGQLK